MTEHRRKKTRKDRLREEQTQKKNISKARTLIRKLQEHGVTTMWNICNFQKPFISWGILKEEEIPKIMEGWEGKPKEMLPVL